MVYFMQEKLECMLVVRARLHQASALTLRQLYHDAWDSVLIENNTVTPDGIATHYQVTPLFSMRTESQASSQSWRWRWRLV